MIKNQKSKPRAGAAEANSRDTRISPPIRRAVQMNDESYQRLRAISERTGKSMTTIMNYLLTSRSETELVREIKAANPVERRRGAPTKRFHSR